MARCLPPTADSLTIKYWHGACDFFKRMFLGDWVDSTPVGFFLRALRPGRAGVGAFVLLSLNALDLKADIFVPADFATIQAAINAASPGDVIHLAAGRYAETLTINKTLTLTGSSATNCVVYSSTNIPLVNITGPGTVTLANFEINGGNYGFGGYNGTSFQGIVATNVNLVLDTMVVNQIINYMVTVVNGTIAATNVALWTRNLLVQCDVGFQLKGCTGTISQLTQDGGRIDHTININATPAGFSNVTIENSRIRTSSGSYGNCIRTYVNSNVRITNCYLYRAAGETVPAYPAFNHSGISVNGYSNTVVIAGNTISNQPWAMYFYGSPGIGGNQLLVESKRILNSTLGGIVWDGMNYKGVDLGGGGLGSRGGNVFSEAPAPPSTFFNDVLFTNSSVFEREHFCAAQHLEQPGEQGERHLRQAGQHEFGPTAHGRSRD